MAIELTAVIAALIAAIASVTVAVIQQRANMAANGNLWYAGEYHLG